MEDGPSALHSSAQRGLGRLKRGDKAAVAAWERLCDVESARAGAGAASCTEGAPVPAFAKGKVPVACDETTTDTSRERGSREQAEAVGLRDFECVCAVCATRASVAGRRPTPAAAPPSHLPTDVSQLRIALRLPGSSTDRRIPDWARPTKSAASDACLRAGKDSIGGLFTVYI